MRRVPGYGMMGMLVVALLLAQGCATQSGSVTGDERMAKVERIDEPMIKEIPPADPGGALSSSRTKQAELAARNETGLPKGALMDVLFDFNRASLRPDALQVLEANARRLKQDGIRRLLLEGRADEVGTVAYNLVLGDRRAEKVKDYLQDLGLSVDIKTTSYGKDRPLCFQHSSDCYQRNRSVHFVVKE